MDAIDPHHLVCAWLDISPVNESRPSSPFSSPPSSADTARNDHDHDHDHCHYHPHLTRTSHPSFPHNLSTLVPPKVYSTHHRPGLGFSSFSQLLPLDGESGAWGGGNGPHDPPPPPLAPTVRYPLTPAPPPLPLPPFPPPPPLSGDVGDGHAAPAQFPSVSTLPSDQNTYRANLESAPALPAKRKRASHSWSTHSAIATSTTAAPSPFEIRAKRRALEILVPSTQFGTTLRPATFPPHVLAILRRFAPAQFEQCCLPFTPEVESLLDASFPHEIFPSYARQVVSPADHQSALAFLECVTRLHNTCTRNSVKALDEAAWYPCVRSMLSVGPPRSPSRVPTLPPPDAHDPSPTELYLTIDATTKTTRKSILPDYPNIKLDHLLVFNPEHARLRHTAAAARTRSLVINAFADTSLDDVLIALGVEVKSPGGSEGPVAAEFQLGVWAAKTLTAAANLAPPIAELRGASCDVAVGLSVCGHVWSMHVAYWSAAGALVMHGPVLLGSTDTLYGTLKILAWVVGFKEWAAETLLADWISRVAGL